MPDDKNLEKELDSKKVKTFRLELYSNTESYDFKAVHERIEKEYDWIRIEHNKDLKEDGTLCVPHWHYVIRCQGYSCRRTHVAEYLEIDKVWILPCYRKKGDLEDSTDEALKYLVHKNRPYKHQYRKNEVSYKRDSNLFNRFDILIANDVNIDDATALDMIQGFIYSQTKHILMPDILEFLGTHNLLPFYKRYNYTVHRMLDEMNDLLRHRVGPVKINHCDRIKK